MHRLGAGLLGMAFLSTVLQAQEATFQARLRALEMRHGGRLGVAVVGIGPQRRLEYRANERFAMCSTFKLLLVAAVLARVDRGEDTLERRIAFGPDDLVAHSPVTQVHLAEGALTLQALCQAAIEVSDNTAANLLLSSLGGPGALTTWLRITGDAVTRLDRWEPDLNRNEEGDFRDTSSPMAMALSVEKILNGAVLADRSRHLLLGWLQGCRTGTQRIRAGLPPTWRAGDKTGSGRNGATNDVAILWPPAGASCCIAVFYTGSAATGQDREAVLAEVGRWVAAEWGGPK
ncbi:MAG: Beta-lactamase precursor [Holophagaceae bacterium]|nr:Beta-lactamase precursor [Holophagaceae bacterium]